MCVPLSLELTRRLSIAQMTLIVPSNIPGYIRNAAAYLGLRLQITDAAITGPCVVYQLQGNITRPHSRDWLLTSGIVDRLAKGPQDQTLGSRIFLARRKTRQLSNQAAIEALLAKRGFVTIYPEDLPAAAQFGLFNNVESIVAIHGAGLAPLLYRHPDTPLKHLVEILPCGHMTDFYRMMAQQVACAWIGVRGQLKAKYIKQAYSDRQMFTDYSLDNFAVDPISLERALNQIGVS